MTNSTSTAGHAPRHWYRWLLVTPFIWQAALAPLVNDIGYQPLGLPFPMAWQMAGIVYASLVIGLVFHLDQRAGLGDEEAGLRRDGGAGKGTLMTLAIVCAILLATLAGRWATAARAARTR